VSKPAAILIAGPTASGKSALALAIAEQTGGAIINADSMQVYRDLRIITARPTPGDESRAPHCLYGYVDAAENYSVGRWYNDIGALLADARERAQIPIIVGGTGLYYTVLIRGLAAVPPIPADIRQEVRARLTRDGAPTLHAALALRDPAAAARLMPGDCARVTRALEVVLATGRPLSDWHNDNKPPLLDPTRTAKIFLNPDRNVLKRRIEARFDAMLAAGALDEVRALASRGLDLNLPAMKAHGVPWLIRHLRAEVTLAEAAARAKTETTQYTKRQVTWFRNQLAEFVVVAPHDAEAAIEAQLRAMKN
jgi:tRNA dimethylallyltransferase